MRLVSKQRFSEFFQEKVKKEHHRNLMMKMMALEVKLLITSMRMLKLLQSLKALLLNETSQYSDL